jgi:ubiquinone biosynthesis protein
MSIINTGKDIKRLNEIIAVLIKYGFGDLLRRIGLSFLVEQAGKLVRSQGSQYLSMKPPERARRAMEELGPCFIKLGQILATRADVFDEHWVEEFAKLQDNTPSLAFDKLLPQLEKSLGQDVRDVFFQVNERALASASMAQVHSAITHSGERVVLKIRKPGLESKIRADLRLLQRLAHVVAVQAPETRRYKPEQMVQEFEQSILQELDFTIEGRNAERISENLAEFNFIKIPKVYWQWSKDDLLVQEFIDGISAKDIQAVDDAGLDRALLASRGAQVVWKMMLTDGLFHADPHPGNFLVMPGNLIAMLDFGMVGKLSVNRRDQLTRLVKSIVLNEAEDAACVLVEWSGGINNNFDALITKVAELIDQYHGIALNDIEFTQLLVQVSELLRSHDILLPADIMLSAKAFVTLEGFTRLVHPEFDIMKEAKPLMVNMLKQHYNPVRLTRLLASRALKIIDRIYQNPSSNKLLNDNFQQQRQANELLIEKLAFSMEDSQYRQTQAMINLGFLLAFCIMMLVEQGPVYQDYAIIPVIGGLGFIGMSLNLTRFQLIMWWQKKSRGL